MAVYDEAYQQLKNAIIAWDMSPVWPTGYAGVRGVMVMQAWPYDRIDDMLKESITTPVGAMTQPIITIIPAHGTGSFRSLGGHFADPSQPSAVRIAERFGQAFMLSTWADELLGGADTVMKIAGQIAGCVLANRNSMTSYRQLRLTSSDAIYEDRPQLWAYDQHVEGVSLQVVNLP